MKPFQKSTRKLSTGSFKPSAGPTNPFEETRKASTHYCFLLVFFCSFYFFALKNRAVVNCSEPHQIRRPSFGRRSYHLASESKRFISGRRYARNETMEGNGSSLLRSRFSLSTWICKDGKRQWDWVVARLRSLFCFCLFASAWVCLRVWEIIEPINPLAKPLERWRISNEPHPYSGRMQILTPIWIFISSHFRFHGLFIMCDGILIKNAAFHIHGAPTVRNDLGFVVCCWLFNAIHGNRLVREKSLCPIDPSPSTSFWPLGFPPISDSNATTSSRKTRSSRRASLHCLNCKYEKCLSIGTSPSSDRNFQLFECV